MTSTPRAKADTACAGAIEIARLGLVDLVPDAEVGEHLGFDVEGERVVTHYFAAERPGYRGWRWSVTVARASRQKAITVDEVVLLPGADAVLAPAWVPWRERVEPGDVGPGYLLPADDDDPRLAPGYTAADERPAGDAVRQVVDELGLGRPRVLSAEGLEQAAERWYSGSHGPRAPIAESAPGRCATCGFLLHVAGPLGAVFGACANAYSPSDGRIVSYDHGCGAHSEVDVTGGADVGLRLPEPVLDTIGNDDVERF
jgi:Protein of unknown function (DUF3027)